MTLIVTSNTPLQIEHSNCKSQLTVRNMFSRRAHVANRTTAAPPRAALLPRPGPCLPRQEAAPWYAFAGPISLADWGRRSRLCLILLMFYVQTGIGALPRL